MRIGIVCPYSFDAPGGVQFHVRDVAEELRSRGHYVRVLAPSTLTDPPPWLDGAGRSWGIPFNGSVALLAYGRKVDKTVDRWLEENDFDVVHIHEPGSPSVGLATLRKTDLPVVATFHSAMERSRIRAWTAPWFEKLFDKISVRIAVSQEARRTLVEHHGGDARIIPNGVFTSLYKDAQPLEKWAGTPDAPTIVFLGRLDEPRKGLPVFAEAIPAVLEKHPGARFLVAGRGDPGALSGVLEKYPNNIEVLGEISEEDKASLLKGATAYVAPQLGGESFGIVLVEAMAAGTLVVASDIAAFRAVLAEGQAGRLFETGSSKDLARTLDDALSNPEQAVAKAAEGASRAQMYDWGRIADELEDTYQAVVS